MGATGLAIGILPLGLKLIKEVRKFADAYKDQDDELSSAKSQIQTIQGCLQILENRTAALDTSSGALARFLQGPLDNVNNQIQKLDHFTQKIRRHETTSNDWEGKAKKGFERGGYPFRQEDLKALQVRLSQLESSLQVALSLVNIHLNCDILEQYRQLLPRPVQQTSDPTEAAMLLTSLAPALVEIADDFGIRRSDIQDVQCRILNLAGSRQAHSTGPNRECPCRPRQQPVQKVIVWGPFAATWKDERSVDHKADCPFRGERSGEWAVGWLQNGRSHLSWFLALSISFSIGRRGLISLSQNIVFRNQIDMKKTPPIRYLEIANSWGYQELRWALQSLNSKLTQEYERHLMYSFRRLLHESDFSIFDVDFQTGENILHAVLHALIVAPNDDIWGIVDLLPLELRESEDFAGFTAWNQALFFSSDAASFLIPNSISSGAILLQGQRELQYLRQRRIKQRDIPWDTIWRYINSLYQSPDLMEDLNITPLGRCIVRRLQTDMSNALNENPETFWHPIHSSESWDLYSLELAALWFPQGLPALWDFGSKRASDSPRSRMMFNSIAGRVSGALLHGCERALSTHFGSSHNATQNLSEYEESERYILDSNCPIHWDTLLEPLKHGFMYYSHRDKISPCFQLLVKHLSSRRRDLANIACTHLSPERLRKLGVVRDIPLDLNARDVWQELQPVLRATYPSLHPGRNRSSVFNLHEGDPIVQALLEGGFLPDQRVQAIIKLQVNYPQNRESIDEYYTRNLWSQPRVSWTLVHCSTGFVNQTRIRAALLPQTHILHVLAVWFAGDLRSRRRSAEPLESNWELELHPHLLREVKDGCTCGCSSNGCTPLTTLLNRLSTCWPPPTWDNYYPNLNPNGRITSDTEVDPDWIRMIASFIDSLFRSQAPRSSVAESFLRFCTFDMLECRHTCCKEAMKLYFGGPFVLNNPISRPLTLAELENQDYQGIWEEDREKLEHLEKLVLELMLLWHEKPRTLISFIDECWEPLIEKALGSVALEPTVVEAAGTTVRLETSPNEIKVFPRQRLVPQVKRPQAKGKSKSSFFRSQADAKMSDEEWERYQRGVLQQGKDALDELCVEITGQKDWATRGYEPGKPVGKGEIG